MIFKRSGKEGENRAAESQTRKGRKALGGKLKQLFSRYRLEDAFFEELEDLLLEADMGSALTMELSEGLQEICRREKLEEKDAILSRLKELIRGELLSEVPELTGEGTHLFLVLGVNGVGKTTTIAKLARFWESRSRGGTVFAAGDTFRAAAVDQLKIQGERAGARVVSQAPGSDPGAVIYDALESARSRGERLVLADTAGRMHNRRNLVKELEKIDRVVRGRLGDQDRYRRLLVIDATTGQNGLRQAEIFHEAVGVDGIIFTKYDSSAKGGIIPSICRNLQIPFAFLGRGEGLDDLEPFDPERYLQDLLGEA